VFKIDKLFVSKSTTRCFIRQHYLRRKCYNGFLYIISYFKKMYCLALLESARVCSIERGTWLEQGEALKPYRDAGKNSFMLVSLMIF
jgi:hypothetical protein